MRGRQDDVRGDERAAAEEADGVVEGDGVGVASGGCFGAADDAGGFEGGGGGGRGIGILLGASDGGGGQGVAGLGEGDGNGKGDCGGDDFHGYVVLGWMRCRDIASCRP